MDCGKALLKVVPPVFGKENPAYCLRHLAENFHQVAGKHSIRKEATKQVVKEMLYRATYAQTLGEYNAAVKELRAYKLELAQWIIGSEPKQWAEAKFRQKRWGRLNNNVIESWNNLMRRLRPMPVSWLVSGHLEKLGKNLGSIKRTLKSGRMGRVSELNKQLQTHINRWDVWLPWSAIVCCWGSVVWC